MNGNANQGQAQDKPKDNSSLSVTEAHPKEEQSVSANVHVEHYFPKGYDPDAEPWKSISRYCAALLRKKEASSEPVKLSGRNEREALLNEITEEWAWKSYHDAQPLWSVIRRLNGEYVQQLPTSLAEDICRKQSTAIVRAVDLAFKRLLSEHAPKSENGSDYPKTPLGEDKEGVKEQQ